ncbi:MAG: hypothetical protein COA75_13940 [Cellvibrionales bacterium]|nr:MAG: hypothetical protein COA75_13940 [Cellvibrionales bacterium]
MGFEGLSPLAGHQHACEFPHEYPAYVAIVNPKKVGLPVNVVIHVSLHSQELSQLQTFQQRIGECEEVMECYLMTGGSDYMLRVVVPDLEHYQHFLVDKLTQIPGISNIQSSFALQQLIDKTELPIGC